MWRAQQTEEYLGKADPENFAILDLVIADGDIDDEELAFLADDESS